jgi:hypothetical protein
VKFFDRDANRHGVTVSLSVGIVKCHSVTGAQLGSSSDCRRFQRLAGSSAGFPACYAHNREVRSASGLRRAPKGRRDQPNGVWLWGLGLARIL